jgi:predicted permease
MTSDQLAFVNRLIYAVSLPALIYLGVAGQTLDRLMHPAIVISTMGGFLLAAAVFAALLFLLRVPGDVRAPFVYGVFWANTAYLGFPLATSAFGMTEGLALAGVVNAFTMVGFNVLGYILIHLWHREKEGRGGRELARMMLSPIIVSAVGGVLTVVAVDLTGARPIMGQGIVLPALLRIGEGFLKLVGGMGLPLALISVGASLRLHAVRGRLGLIGLTVAGKLILTPALTFALLTFFFPSAEPAARGVAVLLMATPASVASYVISRRHGVAPDFVATHLVLSTALSMITIPIWLYFLI